MKAIEIVREESPDTLEGSFTPDLVESKTWLCEKLADILGDRHPDDIVVLGSWFGNIGIFLEQAGIRFEKLTLVDKNKDWLKASERLLQPLKQQDRLRLINADAGDLKFKRPAIVINTSSNEMPRDWLQKVYPSSLVAIQARNNAGPHITPASDIDQFDALFPLSETLFLGKRTLVDPETKYDRYMKIGIK